MALITPEKARHVIPALQGTDEDVRLTGLISAADAIVARFCAWPAADSGRRTLEAVARTEYVDRPSALPTEIRLKVAPVVSITSIAEDTVANRTYSTAIADTDYSIFDAAAGIVFRANGWGWGQRYTRVRYVGGFTSETAQGDLLEGLKLLVRHLWDAPAFANFTGAADEGYRPFRSPVEIPETIRPYFRPYQLAEAFCV